MSDVKLFRLDGAGAAELPPQGAPVIIEVKLALNENVIGATSATSAQATLSRMPDDVSRAAPLFQRAYDGG